MASLAGKKGLIIGIANNQSIAYGCAQVCHREGAQLATTYLNDKANTYVQPLVDELGVPRDRQFAFDITEPGQPDALFEGIEARFGKLDFVIHAMASATKRMTTQRLVDVDLEDFNYAMQVSCHSFLSVSRAAERLMLDGGSIVTMTYVASQRVLGNYHFMAPMKAALESCVKYVADELGPKNIRVHAVSPGAIATRAASGINDFQTLLDSNEARSPLGRLVTPAEVGELTAFLVSPASSGMTGGLHYVDAGFNVTG